MKTVVSSLLVLFGLSLFLTALAFTSMSQQPLQNSQSPAFCPSAAAELVVSAGAYDNQIRTNDTQKFLDGCKPFRFDTFGDQAFWGGMLKLHEAVEGAKLGGAGPGLSPANALALGL